MEIKEDLKFREQLAVEFPIRTIERSEDGEITRVIYQYPTSLTIKWRDENKIIQSAGISITHLNQFNLIFDTIKNNAPMIPKPHQHWEY